MASSKMPFVSLSEEQIDLISCYAFKTKQLCVCVCVLNNTINISAAFLVSNRLCKKKKKKHFIFR